MKFKDFYGMSFLIMLFLFEIINLFFKYSSNYIVIITYIMYISTIWYFDKRFLLRYCYIIFYISTNILGVFLIETSTFYLNELHIISFTNNSLMFITIVHILFIESVRVMYVLFKNDYKINGNFNIKIFNMKIDKTKVIQYIFMVFTIAVIVIFIKVIDKPFFKVKLDRFLYKQMYLNEISEKISNLILYISPLLGVYYFYTKKKRALFVVAISFIYLFWIGHKFSSFLIISYLFALSFIVTYSYKKLKRFSSVGIILVIFLILIVSIQSFTVYGRDFNSNLLYLKNRIAQQGQLWWATYGNEKANEYNLHEIKDEIKTYYKFKLESADLYNSGIYKTMKLVTPYDTFLRKVYDKNSRYAYSTQATVFYYFHGLGLVIFSILSGLLYYLISENLIKSVLGLNIISSILYTRLFVIYDRVLLQSDFYKLFSIEVIIIVILLIIGKWIKDMTPLIDKRENKDKSSCY